MPLYRVLAVWCLISVPHAAADEVPFDRLFTDSKMRTQLDAQRNVYNDVGRDRSEEVVEQPESQQAKKVVTFSGYMKSESDRSVVWIDGKSLLSDEPINGLKFESHDLRHHKVNIRANGKSQYLVPGQVWLHDQDQIREAYQMDWSDSTDKESGQ